MKMWYITARAFGHALDGEETVSDSVSRLTGHVHDTAVSALRVSL